MSIQITIGVPTELWDLFWDCHKTFFRRVSEMAEKKKPEMGRLKPTHGMDVKGGSTKQRMKEAEALERKEVAVGKKNETKKSNPVNKVVGKHAKIKG